MRAWRVSWGSNVCGREGGRDWGWFAMVLSRCVLGVARANWSFHGFVGDKMWQFVETARHMLLSTNVLSPRQHFGTSNCLESILGSTFLCIDIRTCCSGNPTSYKRSQCTDETLCDLGVPEWHKPILCWFSMLKLAYCLLVQDQTCTHWPSALIFSSGFLCIWPKWFRQLILTQESHMVTPMYAICADVQFFFLSVSGC